MFRFGLKKTFVEQLCSIFAHYPQVEKVILYGSRAKGNFKNSSDVDLTLLGGKDLTLKVLYRIMDEVDNLLLPYTIELSIFKSISDPDVIGHIERVGVVFYEKVKDTSHA